VSITKSFVALLSCLMALSACVPNRIPFEQDARDTAPAIKISLIDLPTNSGAASVYEEVGHSRTLYVAPGKKLGVLVRADGVNGVVELAVETRVAGALTASAIARDEVDGNGTIAAWLLIVGTDGAGGSGDVPIAVQLSEGQSATVVATALAPQNQGSEIRVDLTTDCGCPFGTTFDRNCNCGCLATGPAPTQELTIAPLLPMCGVTCCKVGDQCQQPSQICGPSLPPQSRCDDGSVCTDPEFPYCRLGWCYAS
jgi:hypothetical protein